MRIVVHGRLPLSTALSRFAVLLLMGGALSGAAWTAAVARNQNEDSLGLHVRGSGDRIEIGWNTHLRAGSALLTIRDGAEESAVGLSAEQLHGGFLQYYRRSNDVAVALRSFGSNGRFETVRYVAAN